MYIRRGYIRLGVVLLYYCNIRYYLKIKSCEGGVDWDTREDIYLCVERRKDIFMCLLERK
jgi:hypothetical protein